MLGAMPMGLFGSFPHPTHILVLVSRVVRPPHRSCPRSPSKHKGGGQGFPIVAPPGRWPLCNCKFAICFPIAVGHSRSSGFVATHSANPRHSEAACMPTQARSAAPKPKTPAKHHAMAARQPSVRPCRPCPREGRQRPSCCRRGIRRTADSRGYPRGVPGGAARPQTIGGPHGATAHTYGSL